ncbi:MAG: phytanoyl-CoA dioxygenase family protein [Pseudomonadota bacterium]
MHGPELVQATTHSERFERDGFVVVKGLFTPDELAPLRAAADDIVAGFDADAHRSVFRTDDRDAGRDDYFLDSAEAVHCFLEADAVAADGGLNRDKTLAINKIGHALHDHVPAFGAFCRDPRVGALLRELGQVDPEVRQTMYIFKQPGIGGEVRWHQDASYLNSDPGGVIGLWVALEDADRDNGCLWMQPGRHRDGLREIFELDWPSRRGELRTLDPRPWTDDENAVAIEVSAGSLVAFHDHMPHYSSPNRSPRSRHAFAVHTSSAGTPWSAANWLQRRTLPPFAV